MIDRIHNIKDLCRRAAMLYSYCRLPVWVSWIMQKYRVGTVIKCNYFHGYGKEIYNRFIKQLQKIVVFFYANISHTVENQHKH